MNDNYALNKDGFMMTAHIAQLYKMFEIAGYPPGSDAFRRLWKDATEERVKQMIGDYERFAVEARTPSPWVQAPAGAQIKRRGITGACTYVDATNGGEDVGPLYDADGNVVPEVEEPMKGENKL